MPAWPNAARSQHPTGATKRSTWHSAEKIGRSAGREDVAIIPSSPPVTESRTVVTRAPSRQDDQVGERVDVLLDVSKIMQAPDHAAI